MPFYTTRPPRNQDQPASGHMWVPIDDERTIVFQWTYHPTRALTESELNRMMHGVDGQDGFDPSLQNLLPPTSEPFGAWRPKQSRENGYWLDYAAQKSGPNSPQALAALGELDEQIGKLVSGFRAAYASAPSLWLVATEYVIMPVDHVTYPNRVLRQAGLLQVRTQDDGEHLDLAASRAWCLVDHQLAHVFVRDADRQVISQVKTLFDQTEGIAQVLAGDERKKVSLDHPRSGEVILVSTPHSWQAYYWWLDDARAPAFARTVDIHRKPGYDPVELCFDPATRSIPLDASLIKGSHGAPATSAAQRGVLLASEPGVFDFDQLADTDVAEIVLRQFGL
jgi:hypothetical protein